MKTAKTNHRPPSTINPLSGKPYPVMPGDATGPRSSQGKAVSARNATTHGLFARDIVLPSLGEDPEGYRQLAEEFTAQLAPRNLLERHYVEKIAAASWRLRRLHRWQAQLFEDATITEDERLDRLDKVLRHETALHRQIDTAVKMLNKDVPQLYKSRARDQALLETMQIERECRESLESDLEVSFEARELLKQTTAEPEMDYALLDAAPVTEMSENCENELPRRFPLAPQNWGGGASLAPQNWGGGASLAPQNWGGGASSGLVIPGKGIILSPGGAL